MRRVWFVTLAVPIAVAAALWFGANYALEAVTHAALASLIERTREGGVALRAVDFEDAQVQSPFWVRWRGIRAGVERETPGEREPELLGLSVGIVNLRLLGRDAAAVEALGVNLARSRDTPEGEVDETLLEASRFGIAFPVDPFDPTPGLAAAGREVVRLAETGSTPVAIDFDGFVPIRLRGEEVRLGLRTRQTEDGSTLIADREDLQSISRLFNERLTEAEIELISNHVLRAPRLLAIRDQAESRAREAHGRGSGVSEDAYRHVFWSYLLAREFGAKFAEEVTDAHEQGSQNSPAEREMDERNNALGRSYARRSVPEAAVLEMVRHDPDTVRAPEIRGLP